MICSALPAMKNPHVLFNITSVVRVVFATYSSRYFTSLRAAFAALSGYLLPPPAPVLNLLHAVGALVGHAPAELQNVCGDPDWEAIQLVSSDGLAVARILVGCYFCSKYMCWGSVDCITLVMHMLGCILWRLLCWYASQI